MTIYSAALMLFIVICAWVVRKDMLRLEAGLLLVGGLAFCQVSKFISPSLHFPVMLMVDTVILTWMTHMYVCAKARRVEWPLYVALLHFGMLFAHALFYWLKLDYFWYMTAVNVMVYCSAIVVASGPVINAVRAELGLVNFALSLLVGRQLMARDKAA